MGRVVSLVFAAATTAASAAPSERPPLPTPFDGLGADLARAFGGYTLLYYAGAAGSTAALAASGADHELRVAVRRHAASDAYGDVSYYGGYILPLIVPPSIYLAGVLSDDPGLAGAGSAALQALAFTVTTTVVLKIGTGRPFPRHGAPPDAPDLLDHPEYAREFSPFGFAGRYAWPSGHTSSAVSIAAALTAFSPGTLAVPLVAYPVALGIGAGMVVGDHHWVSDFVAGALVGQGIGWSVGASYRERQRGIAGTTGSVRLVPLVGAVRGVGLVGEL